MKKCNRQIKAIMAVIAIFVTLSVILGVVMAATQTNAPAVDENIGNGVNSGEIAADEQPSSEESKTDKEESASQEEEETTPQPTAENTAVPTAQPTVQPTTEPTAPPSVNVSDDFYSAMWISYLEFQSVDFTSKSAFVEDMTEMFGNCADMGLNTVIVQVRPFGDALYKSDIFPSSHLITGIQGDEIAFDPLAEMVKIAHSKGLRIEAWINPYRVRLSDKMPDNIASANPANNTDLVFEVGGGVYYNPALTEVQDMVVEGIAEIVENYDVDGIHLDDYFYNENADMSYDSKDYAASGTKLSQADWRRENVNTLVKKIYKKIKSTDSSVTFGISPQGNNYNNYNVQYSDVKLWLSTEGYVDYIMPQLYWGFGYTTGTGSEDFQFVNLCEEWASCPRHRNVELYIGMGAYRIGDGDGGTNDQKEWSSGNNLMKMVNAVAAGDDINGFALYRYDHLFKNSSYPDLAKSEVEHLTDILAG